MPDGYLLSKNFPAIDYPCSNKECGETVIILERIDFYHEEFNARCPQCETETRIKGNVDIVGSYTQFKNLSGVIKRS